MKKQFKTQNDPEGAPKFRIDVTCYLFLVSCLLLLSSCDYVTNPLLPHSGGVLNTSTTITEADSTGNKKNVFVEDYTGEWCENCPNAAIELDTLIKTYGSRITPMSVNTGYYATPSGLPTPYKNYNYTSATGDVYGGLSGFNIQAFPNGFVNRIGALAQNPSPYSVWGTLVANSISNDTCFIKLKLSTQYDTVSRNLNVTTTSTFIKALSGSYNLVLLLTEDSMIGPQLKIGVGLISNYAHRFVLHDAINSTWGDTLVTNGASLNQTSTKTYSYSISKYYPTATSQIAGANTPTLTCNFKQCYVVAYIYNSKVGSSTQYVVLQSQALKIYQR
ncbi:MAG: Omp28-related outer membrane protein [Bacteroidia bacterium]